ncbi:MAG TPA: type II toxin-antitoxin system prevent-host-death family antitoxin [Candidatus Paceibacterota bacterium]|nr:type II toxin-antitoxin system prevent-host-death family antitoxin [Candidatus Paceibacterota bacterium]
MKTNIIGLKELRENMETYISQVGKGKSFTVVRRSRPVFRVTPVDEWGDEGVWETVVDFRDGDHPNGVPAEDVLKALRTFHESDRKVPRRA